jgi:hypothetical protein
MVYLLLALSFFGRVTSVTEVARREIGVENNRVEVEIDKNGRVLDNNGRVLSRQKIARSEEARRQPDGGIAVNNRMEGLSAKKKAKAKSPGTAGIASASPSFIPPPTAAAAGNPLSFKPPTFNVPAAAAKPAFQAAAATPPGTFVPPVAFKPPVGVAATPFVPPLQNFNVPEVKKAFKADYAATGGVNGIQNVASIGVNGGVEQFPGNPYPAADHPGMPACNNGEIFQNDVTSFLLNESNAAFRWLETWLPIVLEQRTFLRTTSGCASGLLEVAPGLPERFQKSIFATQTSYPLLTRFSARDQDNVLRVGVKILGLDVPMLPPPGPSDLERNTQDFIFDTLADSNGMSPAQLAAANVRVETAIEFLERLLVAQNVTASSLLDRGGMRSDDNMGSKKQAPLESTEYNMNVGTTLVNRFGGPTDPAVKLFINGFIDPSTGLADTPLEVMCKNPSLPEGEQYSACVDGLLQEALATRIQAGPLQMPLYANLQQCGDLIEDSITPWSTTDIMQIATLSLTVIEDLSVCNDTAFTPWHSAEDLSPLGSWQRTRRNPYYQGALQRGATAASIPEMGTPGEDVWTLTDLQTQNTYPTDPNGCHIAIYDGPTSFSNGGVYQITQEWVEGHLGGPLNETCGLFINNWLTRNPMHSNWATNLIEDSDITGPAAFGLVATYVGEFSDGSIDPALVADVTPVQPSGSSQAQASLMASLVAMFCIYYVLLGKQ